VDNEYLVIIGLVVGVGLLFLGSRIRSKARNQPRTPRD
jgi:hypothetical protein